ncbi:MAG: hypothetical protein JF571_04955 [Asticcacaulis sp.]|nr:hypothetical protein [Asticcacaulis sp.]
MSAQDLKAHILPGLLAGARNGLPLDRAGVADSLQALGLTGQALRFDRPEGPAQFDVEDGVADPRAVVPDALRRPLVRLLTAKRQGVAPDVFPAAVARTLNDRRLRLHPFDLPKLDAFVKTHAEKLGAEAMAFNERSAAPGRRQGYFDADALDDATWAQATPAVRQDYIQRRRREDPIAGRALVEAVWPSESADIRVRLLAALREGLGPADAPFLKGLEKDRAPRVRDLAQRLLARLPGHEGDNPAVRAVLERIKVGQTGLLKKRPVLSLEPPATVKAPQAPGWVFEAFNAIGLEDLAAALKLPVGDMIAAAEKDENLLLAFAVMATGDNDLKALDLVAGTYLPDAWDLMIRTGMDDLDGMDENMGRAWADILVRPLTWVDTVPLWGLVKLNSLLDAPVSDALMRDLMKARPWLAVLKDPDKLPADLIDILAVLCPTSQRPALRAQIAPLDPGKTAYALQFLEIMDALEATHV